MKPIEYLGTIFFDLMRIQPRETFYSTSLFLAQAIVTLDMKDKERDGSDTTDNKNHLKKLKYIGENTHERLQKPLAVVEAIVASKERDEWGSEYNGKNNEDEYIELDNRRINILDMYRLLKEAYAPIIMAVVDIVKEYSADYRMNMGSSDTPSWLGGNDMMV